jgi:hypothetical protein
MSQKSEEQARKYARTEERQLGRWGPARYAEHAAEISERIGRDATRTGTSRRFLGFQLGETEDEIRRAKTAAANSKHWRDEALESARQARAKTKALRNRR